MALNTVTSNIPGFLHGITVTLTTANTKYNLYTLLNAVDTTTPAKCRGLNIQSDLGNSGIQVSVGDLNISATRRAIKLGPGDSIGYEDGTGDFIEIGDFYLFSDTNTAVVNVSIIQAA